MSNVTNGVDDYTMYGSYKAGILIWKVVPPILLLLGTVGNSLCIFVLTRKSIRSSTTALYLTALAFSDLAVLYSGLLRQWLIYLFEVDVRHFSEAGCKLNIWLVYCSLDFSAWILIVVTLERVISAWLPHNYRSVCTKKSAAAVMVSIGVFILALNSHLLYGMVFNNVYDEFGNVIGVDKCEEINEDYYIFFNKTWPWIDLCVFCVIPFSVIVVGNTLILVKVVNSHRKLKSAVVPSVTVNSHRSPSSGHGKQSSMTTMLFTLNVVFLLCTSPVSIYNVGYSYWMSGASEQTVANLDLWWAIVNMFQYTNNSLNFLLYCLSGTKFRKEVIKIFCRTLSSVEDSCVKRSSKYSRTRYDSRTGTNRRMSPSNSPRSSNTRTPIHSIHNDLDNDFGKALNNTTLHPDMALNIGGKKDTSDVITDVSSV